MAEELDHKGRLAIEAQHLTVGQRSQDFTAAPSALTKRKEWFLAVASNQPRGLIELPFNPFVCVARRNFPWDAYEVFHGLNGSR